MTKVPFVTKEKAEEIIREIPTPFHIYDEQGIRANAQAVKDAFAWNPGFREYFAVKANPNPFLIQILQEYGCGTDCSSLTELMLSKELHFTGIWLWNGLFFPDRTHAQQRIGIFRGRDHVFFQ